MASLGYDAEAGDREICVVDPHPHPHPSPDIYPDPNPNPNPDPNPNPSPSPNPNPDPDPNPNQARFDSAYDQHGKAGMDEVGAGDDDGEGGEGDEAYESAAGSSALKPGQELFDEDPHIKMVKQQAC